jgi:hypothetical protein
MLSNHFRLRGKDKNNNLLAELIEFFGLPFSQARPDFDSTNFDDSICCRELHSSIV